MKEPTSNGQFRFTRDEVRKMAVVVTSLGQHLAMENVIEAAFVEGLLGKSYDVVTRSSLNEIARELLRRMDRGFDLSTAAEVGKLAGASHILVVQMPSLTETYDGTNGSSILTCSIIAQVIEVSTGRILGIVTEEQNTYGSRLSGGSVGAVRRVSQRAVKWFP